MFLVGLQQVSTGLGPLQEKAKVIKGGGNSHLK